MLLLVTSLSVAAALDEGKQVFLPLDMYPAAALAAHEQGEVTIRIAPTSASPDLTCAVVKSSKSDILDKATCALIAPRLKAVLDIRKPMKVKAVWYIPPTGTSSRFDGAIGIDPSSWVNVADIGRGPFPGQGSGKTEISIDVGTDGNPSMCRITASSGRDDLDKLFCTMLTSRALFLPAIDAEGNARVAHANTAITWWKAGQ